MHAPHEWTCALPEPIKRNDRHIRVFNTPELKDFGSDPLRTDPSRTWPESAGSDLSSLLAYRSFTETLGFRLHSGLLIGRSPRGSDHSILRN